MENIGNNAAEIPAPIIQNWEYYKIQVKTAIQYQSRMILSFNFQISELQTPLSSKKKAKPSKLNLIKSQDLPTYRK